MYEQIGTKHRKKKAAREDRELAKRIAMAQAMAQGNAAKATNADSQPASSDTTSNSGVCFEIVLCL